MSPRIAIAGWFGSDNLGDELILRALARQAQERGAHPVAVSIDKTGTEAAHRIDAIQHSSPIATRRLERSLRQMDGLLVTGGLIQSETSMWNIPFHATRIRSARLIPGYAVGLGVGRTTNPPAAVIARRVLGRLRTIVVRDHDSADRLLGWGLDNIRVGSDVVLGEQVNSVNAQDSMCVILRPPNRRGIGTAAAKASKPPSSSRIAALAEGIAAISEAIGFSIRMVAFQKSRDMVIHQSLADHLATNVELLAPTLDDVMSEVGRSRLVITMRYHGAIAALLHGRPAVLLDYSPKMGSLAEEGGRWAPLVNPLQTEPDRMIRAAEAALAVTERVVEARESLRSRLIENDRVLEMVIG